MSQIRADNITNRQGTGAPIFVNGIRVVGLTSIANIVANTGTFNGAVSIGGTLTYEDVTNIDAVGLITARTGVKVLAGGVDVTSGGINIASGGINVVGISTLGGNVTATGVVDINPSSHEKLKITAVPAGGSDWAYMSFYGTDGARNGYLGADGTGDLIVQRDGGAKTIYLDTIGLGIGVASPATSLQLNGNYSENIVAVSGTAIDCSAGNYFTKTITGATTFTFTNVPTGVAYAFTLEVTLNGSNSIAWPTPNVKWPADTAPQLTDGKTQVFVFLTDDGGTRWRGSSLVDYTN